MRTPDAFDRWALRWSENLNPILVKEVRQGLRTKVFWIFFSLLLFTCLCIAMSVYGASDTYDVRSGRVAFGFVFGTLGLVQFFVIPYTAYRSMSREAEDETWVLLTLTGLGPRKILGGKLQSFVVQGLLYSSAAAPFLLFSYYLNGIDLPTIVLTTALGVAYLVFLVGVAVSLATLADTRLVRSLLHFVLLGFLLWATSVGIAGGVGAPEIAKNLHRDSFLLGAAIAALAMVSTGLLLFELASSRLSLVTESYAKGPRKYLMLQWLCGLSAFGLIVWVSGEFDFLIAAQATACGYLTTVGLMVTSDLDGLSAVHAADSKALWILKPGALRGFVLLVVMMILSSALCLGFVLSRDSVSRQELQVMWGAPAYALIYLSASHLVGRAIAQSAFYVSSMVRVALLGLLILGCGLPPIFGQLIDEIDHPLINVFNPIVGTMNLYRREDTDFLLAVIWAAAIGLMSWAFFTLWSRDKTTS
jgi:hypothetical protein